MSLLAAALDLAEVERAPANLTPVEPGPQSRERLLTPETVRLEIDRLIAVIDELVTDQVNAVLHHPRFRETDISSVRKLGFAGASMTDGLLKELQAAFRPELFVNHYGSSEIYTFTIDANAPAKPGSAGAS